MEYSSFWKKYYFDVKLNLILQKEKNTKTFIKN
jgi:hypothetical protein